MVGTIESISDEVAFLHRPPSPFISPRGHVLPGTPKCPDRFIWHFADTPFRLLQRAGKSLVTGSLLLLIPRGKEMALDCACAGWEKLQSGGEGWPIPRLCRSIKMHQSLFLCLSLHSQCRVATFSGFLRGRRDLKKKNRFCSKMINFTVKKGSKVEFLIIINNNIILFIIVVVVNNNKR